MLVISNSVRPLEIKQSTPVPIVIRQLKKLVTNLRWDTLCGKGYILTVLERELIAVPSITDPENHFLTVPLKFDSQDANE